ncbi:MAG TPA: class I SAM-dependent methyltransferase, partial [Bryobacteraceae bacterium]
MTSPDPIKQSTFNQEQYARWNGSDGECWSREQERLDRVLAPILEPLLEFAAPAPGSAVMDIGCGCGATTLELARRVGPEGRVTAIDISGPMLARAKERLSGCANTTFRLGDAAVVPLADLHADLAVSRFGVMFFGDPVAAFANLRTGLAPGGRLRFVCWRAIQENPWLQIPLHAVYEHVPRLPKPGPEEPGPFSFADSERVTRILTTAGFSAPSFTPLDVPMDLAAGGGLEDAVRHSVETGPARRALEGQPDEIRARAADSIQRALAPYA